MLDVLGGFWSTKTIKLSDSFGVFINESSDYIVNCTGFTIPKLEYKEEVQLYGNTGQTFLIPNYESCNKLTLEFYEETSGKMYDFLIKNLNFKLEQKYDTLTGLSYNKGTYKLNKNIKHIKIKISDNRFRYWIYQYNFSNLKIVDYTLYDLDYQNESPCKISITFGFEGYYAEDIYEEIKYDVIKESKPTPQNNTTAPIISSQTNKSVTNKQDVYVASEKTINRNNEKTAQNTRQTSLEMVSTNNQTGGQDAFNAAEKAKKQAKEKAQKIKTNNKSQLNNIETVSWTTQTNNGKTVTTEYEIEYSNGTKVNATQNQQQYESRTRQLSNRSPSQNTSSPSNTQKSYDASVKAKEKVNQKDIDLKTKAIEEQNKNRSGYRGKPPATYINTSVQTNNNETEQFAKNGSNR